MTREAIQKDFEVFVHDGEKAVGAVRDVTPNGRPEILVYVENAGDFVVPLSAVREVIAERVVLDCAKLDLRLKRAIGHAHDSEDPRI
ncbi:MAG: hypothetical protein KGJ66_14850 [Alphaproteobacteria bacterium]|nr:hypothetical protein [Alphaproteobacteria bacterium]